ncbi:hypothetical protein EL84_25870 [Paenibacillus sp. VT-400]|uniref:hypothetical protein n=1 Tax=Paenibacillus sp. VT-400 TaxID=1495853 RepID=UPI000649CE60|nr:hypothetical protein [Paenibacillus sp. VT-400]KLU55473.1 hypothetical protein EL84_25870 [Paenibacillus sp. VT-400]
METAENNEQSGEKEEVEKQGATDNKKRYESGPFLLTVIQAEYEYELERGRSIESRTGIFIAFLGALLVFMLEKLKLPKFTGKTYTLIEATPFVLSFLFFVGALLTILISVYMFIKVLSVKTHKRLKLSGFTAARANENENALATAIMVDYQQVVTRNNEVNTEKVLIFKKGTQYAFAALILAAIGYIINLFIS